MISNTDKSKILELTRKYGIEKILLFGSSLEDREESNDIDLAVEGIQGSLFFKFYGELILNLSKLVDLVDLKKKSKFNELIRAEGVVLND
ncbi:MAG: hypothetical protein DWQ06_16135 [Calditrichaeota bacterium]|nr:MAG: hypothetical protein DWQ06_16135 [Calditrichota bacterium]